ncbi:prepilin peptidase [Candidatus Saccharibacteria bacterium]|nr:MAG: prepilin peptidase [Candidatus Saccharibacteria bacterium]
MIEGFVVFMLGAALGSFSLVLAWRTHAGKDWVRGRSSCDRCHKLLGALDMVPVLSWLALGGRCRFCKHKLDPRLFLAELGLGMVALASYLFWPLPLVGIAAWLHFGLWLVVILPLLAALFWYDLTWCLLPERFMRALIIFAGLEAAAQLWAGHMFSVTGLFSALLGGILCGGFFWLLYKASKGRWIGDGDSILGFGLGLLVGSPLAAFILVFLSSIIGTLVSLPLLINKKWGLSKKIPYGPLLIISAIVVQLAGNRLVDWYSRLVFGS